MGKHHKRHEDCCGDYEGYGLNGCGGDFYVPWLFGCKPYHNYEQPCYGCKTKPIVKCKRRHHRGCCDGDRKHGHDGDRRGCEWGYPYSYGCC